MCLWTHIVKYIEKEQSAVRARDKYAGRKKVIFEWTDSLPSLTLIKALVETDVVCNSIFGWRHTANSLQNCTGAEVASKAECNPVLNIKWVVSNQEMKYNK